MGDPQHDMAEALRQAMQMEMDGYHFYQMAAQGTSDPQGRATFEDLAGEEMAHYRYLQKHYEAVRSTGRASPDVRLPRPSGEKSKPIFSDELVGRLADAHFEMSALSIAVQLELSTIRFYKTQAEAADDKDLRQFYADLVDWESGHYDVLSRQQEALKEDYWSAASFAPF